MSERRSVIGLVVAAGLLVLIILSELVFAGEPPAPEIDPASVLPALLSHGDADHGPAASPTVLLDRPLFAIDRHPVAQSPHHEASAQESTELPRLAGIVFVQGAAQAIFQASRNDKPIVLNEGGSVSGYTVKKIAASEVTVLGPGGEQVLTPRFDPNAVPEPAPGPVRRNVTPNIPGPPLPPPNVPFNLRRPPGPPGMNRPLMPPTPNGPAQNRNGGE